MRFLDRRTSLPTLAFVTTLLLLMPAFSVFGSGGAVAAQNPLAAASALVSTSSGTGAISNYKSVGAADPSMPVIVSVVVPLRNLPTLTSLVKESSDPSSADFRHFLTYSQASEEFLPTQGQYQSVLDYLTSSGFTVEFTALDSTIVVQGTAGQVSQYLGQGVDMFTNGTYSYYETTGASTLSGAYSYGSNSSGLLMRPDFTTSSSDASGAIPSQNVTFTEGGQDTKLLQTVYNATGLLSKGVNGSGYTVGLLDFYGSPLASSDLALFDTTYGYPAPPSFQISPIGPYNPNLGASLGWDGEIDLDVQASHAMAPGANIVLYPANGALSLSSAIAGIVQDGRANVVSQSFGIPEWEYYETGPLPYLFNMVFADDYYMLGSAMGMTFLASSGDGGGSGFSAGPEGGAQYPATSPYVTTLGGTATYISTTAGGALTFNQTAWSNLSFIPDFVNEGGSGGGVSVIEPTPWYQSSLQVPASFPDGRMVPDLSLDASGTPGTFIIFQGSPTATGGTSESSPLFAGLLTLIMGSQKGTLGLLNPVIYDLAGSSKTYTTAFTPITFGYTIPWVSKFGYNLATGWGTPNIGEIARLYSSAGSASSTLSVNVQIGNPGTANYTDFDPGQQISILATVNTPTGTAVTAGTFTANLQTLGGKTAAVALAYNSTQRGWVGTITVGNQSGVAYVNVVGTTGAGLNGSGFAPTFVGYLANFAQPLGPYPWTFLTGLTVAVTITDLYGVYPSFPSEVVSFSSYSILANKYDPQGTAPLNFTADSGYYIAGLGANFPSGPMVLMTTGAVVGYLPFISGISLLGTDIYPQVVAEPGSVAPGQSLTIVASLLAPENIYLAPSDATGGTLGPAIAVGSNVTATLVSPSGVDLVNVSLANEPCTQALRVCGADLSLINGYLTIPATARPGLYTVLLNASYNDETTGFDYMGGYWGQVYVAAGQSSPKISVGPSTLFEGETASITASITYPNGQEVTKGVYTALIYPETSQTDYSTIMHSSYAAFDLISLTYDANINAWTANATMPSPYDSSLVSSINANAEYYGGPYDVYVSGISADGVPTNSSMSAQQAFYVQPYVYKSNSVTTDVQQTSRLALANVTINAGSSALSLSDDYFVGNDTVTGSNVTITSSTVTGTLNLGGGKVTLNGVTGGDIVVTNGVVVLQHSDLSSLTLGKGATASIDPASSSQRISPALPVLTISSPVANATYAGSIDARVTMQGGGVTALSFYLDGKQLPSLPGGAPTPGETVFAYTLNTTSVADGTHTFTVVASQSDLLNSTASVSFSTDNHLVKVTSSLATASSSIATLQSNLSSDNRTINDLTYLAYLAIIVAVVAIIMGAYALRGGKAPWKY